MTVSFSDCSPVLQVLSQHHLSVALPLLESLKLLVLLLLEPPKLPVLQPLEPLKLLVLPQQHLLHKPHKCHKPHKLHKRPLLCETYYWLANLMREGQTWLLQEIKFWILKIKSCQHKTCGRLVKNERKQVQFRFTKKLISLPVCPCRIDKLSHILSKNILK